MEEAVGKSYPLCKRIKLGGVGSRRMVIAACSGDIQRLLALDKYTNYCNLEIRPKGIVVYFRSRLETYALAVPFAELALFQDNLAITIQHGEHFVTLRPFNRDQPDALFIAKVLRFQKQYLEALQ